MSKYKYEYMLPVNNDFIHYIDKFFWYHEKHLRLRQILKEHEDLLLNNPDDFKQWIYDYKFAEKQIEVNESIKAYFILIMIELYKKIEEDNVFSGKLDENISMEGFSYYRVYHGRVIKGDEKYKINRITQQIRHFRDACVHKDEDKISTYPEFVEYNIDGGNIKLPFVSEEGSDDWYFMIGGGALPFNRLKTIIEYTLNYYYSMTESTKKRIKKWYKEKNKKGG